MTTIEPPAGLWPEAADLFLDVVEALGSDMLPAQLAALTQAARLVTQADSARDAIGGAWLIPGPRGVEVANPLLTVEQRAREGAARVLAIREFASAASRRRHLRRSPPRPWPLAEEWTLTHGPPR